MESDQQELLIEISSFLNQNKIPYLVTGAWSVVYYGRPRASHDIDFVVELYPEDVSRVLKALAKLSDNFIFQESAVTTAINQKGMFNLVHLPTNLKLDFWLLTSEPFDKSRFARKQEVKALGRRIILASPEDTILQKLRWYKISPVEKSLIDAAFVYQIQKKNLDLDYLSKWAKKIKVTRNLNKLDRIDLEPYI